MAESALTDEIRRLQARIAELERRNFQLQTIYDIGWELERRPELLLDPTATDSLRVILTTIMGAFGATCGTILQTGLDYVDAIVIQRDFEAETHSATWSSTALSADYCRWRANAPVQPRSWLAARPGADEDASFVRWLRAGGLQVWVPFQVDDQTIGGVGLGQRFTGEPYQVDDVALLENIVDNALVRLRQIRLLAQSLAHQREQYRIRGLFEQFMVPQVVDMLLDGRLKLGAHGQRQTATILMADLRNSTPLIEQLHSEAMVCILNDYFAAMTEIVFRYEGTVDKFMGDSILAIFGAPISHQSDPDLDDVMRAVRVSLEMQAAFTDLAATWQLDSLAEKPVGLGIGICTGEVVIGSIGSAKRLEYTAIGPPVNLAARLSKLARGGETYIDERTYLAASPALKVRRLRPIRAKGFRQPVRIFQVREICPADLRK